MLAESRAHVAELERLIEQQALTLGVNDIFLAAAAFYLVMILPVALAAPVRPRGASGRGKAAVAGGRPRG